jgi:hypothetical protein
VESLGVGVGSGVGASQKQKTPRRSPDDRDWAAAFEDHWWPLYRSFRPDGKAEARREWDRIQARGQEAFDVIYHALELEAARWKADRTEAQYIPHARTWLHQKRYLDHGELPLSSTSEPTTIADSLHATDLPGTTL